MQILLLVDWSNIRYFPSYCTWKDVEFLFVWYTASIVPEAGFFNAGKMLLVVARLLPHVYFRIAVSYLIDKIIRNCMPALRRARARITSSVWASIHPVWRRCSSFPYEEYAQSSRLARRASQHPNRGSYSCANPHRLTPFTLHI